MPAESRFHTLVKVKILEQIELAVGDMATGQMTDYPAYKFQVGYINALRKALDLCEETEREFDV